MQAGKLDSEVTDSAGRPMNEHSLTFGQLTVLEESLPGGKCGKRHGGAVNRVERFWLGRLGDKIACASAQQRLANRLRFQLARAQKRNEPREPTRQGLRKCLIFAEALVL